MSSNKDHNFKEIRHELKIWLKHRLNEDAFDWLSSTAAALKGNPEDWFLYTSFSTVPQHTGKDVVQLRNEELDKAGKLRRNWKPVNWSADQFGRVYLLLNYADQDKETFLEKIEKIFVTSDLGEAVALYKGLPLYPYAERFKERAAEGIRSNMTTVFNAVAHYNPYPSEYLGEGAWNQMVLKALFVESALYPIAGIDERANKTLAKMLVEYAHERWSAGREISPELWRPVGPFIKDDYAKDIKKALNHPDKIQKQAAILALLDSNYSKKDELLKSHRELVNEMKEQKVSWDDIGRRHEAE